MLCGARVASLEFMIEPSVRELRDVLHVSVHFMLQVRRCSVSPCILVLLVMPQALSLHSLLFNPVHCRPSDSDSSSIISNSYSSGRPSLGTRPPGGKGNPKLLFNNLENLSQTANHFNCDGRPVRYQATSLVLEGHGSDRMSRQTMGLGSCSIFQVRRPANQHPIETPEPARPVRV